MSAVVIGSSGGGTATLGHTDPIQLLSTINKQLQKVLVQKNTTEDGDDNGRTRAMHGIRFALFISLHGGKGMDSANVLKDRATLWTVGIDNGHMDSSSRYTATSTFQVRAYYTGLLKDVNAKAKQLEESIIVPYMVENNSTHKDENDSNNNTTTMTTHGIICISCDPSEVNYNILSTAASYGIPVTGSGGTSLSAAVKIHPGLQLVGNAGGSVATTTYTRAVSYVHALASHWDDLDYHPLNSISEGDQNSNGNDKYDNDTVKPQLRSVLDACLPSFLAVCLACHFLHFIQYLIDLMDEDPDNSGGDDYDYYLLQPIKKLFPLARKVLSDSDIVVSWIDQLLSLLKYQALPTVCSVVTTTSLSPEHGSTAIMASTVASFGCWGSIFAGLLAGWVVSQMVSMEDNVSCSKKIVT